ncbi:ribosome silencing factor [Erysipelothrix sp. D19-032]
MKELKDLIVATLDERKANDIKVVDFENGNPLVDYFVIADKASHRQIKALADHVVDAIEKAGYKIKTVESERESSWILIDAYDVVAHIFLTEDRAHYNLEKLYQDLIK